MVEIILKNNFTNNNPKLNILAERLQQDATLLDIAVECQYIKELLALPNQEYVKSPALFIDMLTRLDSSHEENIYELYTPEHRTLYGKLAARLEEVFPLFPEKKEFLESIAENMRIDLSVESGKICQLSREKVIAIVEDFKALCPGLHDTLTHIEFTTEWDTSGEAKWIVDAEYELFEEINYSRYVVDDALGKITSIIGQFGYVYTPEQLLTPPVRRARKKLKREKRRQKIAEWKQKRGG